MKGARNVQSDGRGFSMHPRPLDLCAAGAVVQASGKFCRKEDPSAALHVFSAQRHTFPTGQVRENQTKPTKLINFLSKYFSEM